MANTDHKPPPAHTVAAAIAGLILLVYVIVMTGQAVGLYVI